ncbi:ATP-binding protein [Actinacidiphila acidipaludis]|uniref:ATP-binding protein n=1 Tax=Actinacidiphila acidipaludis TaxID=2873382 RepID=A0ABS7Q2F2_9ACTN|nr:ATP-binding protein [Streptomyces acidipaludis]MBY8877317.1 ATP-binding protein [Streptomyces acidipaludis]
MDKTPPGDDNVAPRSDVLRAAAAFSGDPAACSRARDFTAAFLRRAARADDRVQLSRCGDVVLVVTELLTNAMRHAPGPCALTLELVGVELALTVSDTSAQRPTPQPFAPQRVGGHGLHIVMALAKNVYSRQTPGGKAVRAVMSLA